MPTTERTPVASAFLDTPQVPSATPIERRFREAVVAIVDRINGFIGHGTGAHGEWDGNLDGQWLHFTTPATPDEEFVVPHGLGRIPIGYDVKYIDAAGIVYASTEHGWTSELLYLKCNVASARVRIVVQ